jgi:DNA-binding CsgD family transcriptional regulator
VGEVCEASAIRSPAAFPWRSELALALAGGDRHDEAVQLAREELRLAEQCDVDRARGQALRALGLLEGGRAGLEHLEAAVRALERSPARLELGWATYELGAALRRANRRRDARLPLDRALDLALVCGAELLAERAGEQLEALGARPRSVLLTGAESLTPSERRVCRLATEGLKNAQIAQALFVSLKTVETHLHSAYRKLDIASRTELPQTIGAPRR